jgi:hypothetical protein
LHGLIFLMTAEALADHIKRKHLHTKIVIPYIHTVKKINQAYFNHNAFT